MGLGILWFWEGSKSEEVIIQSSIVICFKYFLAEKLNSTFCKADIEKVETMADEFGDAIMQYLPSLRIPTRSDFIHSGKDNKGNTKWHLFQDESILGFENPNSEHGLFIDLISFQSVGIRHLEYFSRRNNGGIYLRYKLHPGDTEPNDRSNYSLIILPQKLEVALPMLDANIEHVPTMVSEIV